MSRQMLGAIIYIEDVLQKENPTDQELQNAQKYLDDAKKFPILKKSKSISKSEEIEAGVQLILEFSGFEEITPSIVQKLKDVFIYKFVTMSRQMAVAERRKRNGLDIPYKSALQWTLKLSEIHSILDLKKWYDETYLDRFRRLKQQFQDGNRVQNEEIKI